MRILRPGLALVLFASVCAVFPQPAGAQALRGGEFRLNQNAAGFQLAVDVATAANGDFVAVWLEAQASPPQLRVEARRFAADGRAKGGDILVAVLPGVPLSPPRVAVDAAGRFIVVWTSPFANPLRPAQVFAQRFDATGRPLGARLAVRPSPHVETDPDVAMAADGRAVIVWSQATGRFDPEDVEIQEISFRRLAANGAFAGPAVLSHEGELPRVAVRGNGAFAIASQIYGFDASLYDVYLSLFSPTGVPVRAIFQVNAGPNASNSQFDPALAIAPSGKMFVSWTDRAGDGGESGATIDDTPGIAGQLLAADGTPIGANVRINTFWQGSQEASAVAATPSGGFLVAWASGAAQDGDGFGIFERQFAADGRKLGTETRINLARDDDQLFPAVALAPNGRGVAAWAGRDGDGTGVLARRFEPPA
ncbi:MAG TPA: hypothetical protein VN783_15260, partial [Thermoanaerobaculia bacterium]|nr:hypothetical protein [Thermoanaerobaculia bacterium]